MKKADDGMDATARRGVRFNKDAKKDSDVKGAAGLQLNLGGKDVKDVLDLSSDSDSEQDYAEVNEIVE